MRIIDDSMQFDATTMSAARPAENWTKVPSRGSHPVPIIAASSHGESMRLSTKRAAIAGDPDIRAAAMRDALDRAHDRRASGTAWNLCGTSPGWKFAEGR
jgi:hypothetical protein